MSAASEARSKQKIKIYISKYVRDGCVCALPNVCTKQEQALVLLPRTDPSY